MIEIFAAAMAILFSGIIAAELVFIAYLFWDTFLR